MTKKQNGQKYTFWILEKQEKSFLRYIDFYVYRSFKPNCLLRLGFYQIYSHFDSVHSSTLKALTENFSEMKCYFWTPFIVISQLQFNFFIFA